MWKKNVCIEKRLSAQTIPISAHHHVSMLCPNLVHIEQTMRHSFGVTSDLSVALSVGGGGGGWGVGGHGHEKG